MLVTTTMLRSVLAVALLAATSTVASAGTYLGLGIGTAPGMSISDSNVAIQGTGRSGKILLGMRFGRLSIEGAAGRYGLVMDRAYFAADGTQLSAAVKYSYPLGDNFEVFGRGGIEHSSFVTSDPNHDGDSASGNGWLLGAGFEYRLNAVIAGGSLFVDYEHVDSTLKDNQMRTYDASSGVWMAGVTLSL